MCFKTCDQGEVPRLLKQSIQAEPSQQHLAAGLGKHFLLSLKETKASMIAAPQVLKPDYLNAKGNPAILFTCSCHL